MKNIFKSTFRNFVRKPLTNLINLVGLSISLALVIILSMYCYSELTTDNFHKNGDRVFLYSKESNRIYTPAILKDQIDVNVPEVESSVRVAGSWEAPVFQSGDKDPITSDIIFADPDFFKFFTYKAVEGDLEQSLKNPMSVVLTKDLARKFFGNESAIGKTLKYNNKQELMVTAVIEKLGANSSLSFSSVTNNETRRIVQPNEGEFKEWGWNNFQTFLLLKSNTNPVNTAKRIEVLFPDEQQKKHTGAELIPLKKLYFSDCQLFGSDYLRFGDMKKIMILVMVAGLVLIIALVNFINISSAKWHEKIRQTGVLKVIGAGKATILRNALSEAFFLFLMSLVLAVMLVQVLFPFIRSFTGIQFNPQLLYTPSFLLISIVGTFILSLIFSIIPAMRISSSKAVDNLKKNVEPGQSKSLFRGILVTIQFIIAIVLISFTVLVQKQVNYGSNNLGLNQENIIGIKLTPQLDSKKEVLKKLLQEKPSVDQISFTQYFPGRPMSHWTTNMAGSGKRREFNFDTFNADASFYRLTGLLLTQGRFPSEDLTTDRNKMVVNETFIRENKVENPIGTKLVIGFDKDAGLSEIIGVVKDFHYKSFSQPIGSLVIQTQSNASYCLVKISSMDFNSLHNSIQEVKAAAASLSPSFPVEISFFDQAVENLYHSELQFRRAFSLFAGCAIVISCMGILAMSLFASQRRIKEIGIRKVNGATVSEILAMLNKDFVKWVAIAFVIATPIAYYVMNKWIGGFAYKTELSWWIFTLAGLLALGIALLTISWQSWRAASRNPIEALRYE
jgi:putative ABC transport system permease protein